MNYSTIGSEVRHELDERRDLKHSQRFVFGLGLLTISVITFGQAALSAVQIALQVTV